MCKSLHFIVVALPSWQLSPKLLIDRMCGELIRLYYYCYILSLFLLRDAHSAKRGIAIVSHLSVHPLMLRYHGHVGWTSSKLITLIISLASLHLGATTSAM